MDEELKALIEQAKQRMRDVSQRLYDESSSLEDGETLSNEAINEWYNAMAREIATYHQAANLLGAKRGKPPLDEWALANDIRNQLSFLQQFRDQVKNEGRFTGQSMTRAGMYGSAITSTYWRSATDYLPLPAMPAEGTLCFTNCKCSWRIEELDGDGNYNCYWVRAADDSCGTCIARERIWSPLQIRDGILQ